MKRGILNLIIRVVQRINYKWTSDREREIDEQDIRRKEINNYTNLCSNINYCSASKAPFNVQAPSSLQCISSIGKENFCGTQEDINNRAWLLLLYTNHNAIGNVMSGRAARR